MFILSCTMEALAVKEEFWQDGAMAINMLKQNIQECIEVGYFRKDINPDEISLILWSQVHGMVSLYNKERLNIYAVEDKQALMFRSYEVFLSMVQKSLS